MPKGNVLKEFMDRLHSQRIERREAHDKVKSLLPPDLTGTVFSAARKEAAKIREWQGKLEEEITRIEADLDAAERGARAKCAPVMTKGRRKGDVLFGYEVKQPEPHPQWYVKTEAALEYQRERVQPLRARLAALRREITRREQELHQLRRIAEKAAAGDVALVHFLSDTWRSRLELGAGVEGIPAKLISYHAVPSDRAGAELPPEALDAEGRPDLPKARVRA